MIPKGNQRGGGQQLATHLMNSFDNDRVAVAEVRGAIAQDLHGAFAEWYAQSKATNCSKYIYSLSINPDHRQGPFTREHYYDFIRRAEKRLRLENQPRAVIFHVKYGREHCHVIWSRIDMAKGKAVQISHDHQKLRMVAREYAHDHKLTLPPGMRQDRGKARFAFRAAAENLGEKQQQERSGITKQQRREQITKLWGDSSDARSFAKALEANGYFLARGDQRAYVVVDLSGEIHSLSRQINGVKAKEIKARLGPNYDLDRLPTAETAQKWASDKREALLRQQQEQKFEDQKRASLEKRAEAAKATAQQRRDDLAKAHAARRSDLDAKKQRLAQRHDAERRALGDLQGSRNAEIARQRSARQPKGIIALLSRVTGYDAFTTYRQKKHDRKMEGEFKAQKDALDRRHAREMEDFRHREHGLTSLEKRERRSLETVLRREVFRRIAAPQLTKAPAPQPAPAQRQQDKKAPQLAQSFREAAPPRPPAPAPARLTGTQQAKADEFKRTAAEISTPQKVQQRGQDVVHPAQQPGGQKTLTEAFKDRAAPPATQKPPAAPVGLTAEQGSKVDEFKRAAADITAPQKEQPRAKEALRPAQKPEGGAALQQKSLSEIFRESTAAPAKAAPPSSGQGGAGKTTDTRSPEFKENAADLTPAQRRALSLARTFQERAAARGPQKDRDQDRDKHYRPARVDYSLRR